MLKVRVYSNSGMLALLHRNQVLVLNGELALICTSSLVSMQLVEGTSRLTAALAAALSSWDQRIKEDNACSRERSTYANAHAREQGSILRESKSSRMERLGYQMLQLRLLYLHHLAHVSNGQQQRIMISRSIRPVPNYTALVTKPTFVVAAASLTRLRLASKEVAHHSRHIQPYRLHKRWTNHQVMNTSVEKCRKALFAILILIRLYS